MAAFEGHADAQHYLQVYIGSEQEDCTTPWLTAGLGGFWGDEDYICAAYPHQMFAAKKGTLYATGPAWRDAVGHEFGHTMGLWDAYYTSVDQMLENEETTVGAADETLGNPGKHNVMGNQACVTSATPNDIEMALYSYAQRAQGNAWIWHAYQYSLGDDKKLSPVITWRYDNYPNTSPGGC
jgi:hypothetical protein